MIWEKYDKVIFSDNLVDLPSSVYLKHYAQSTFIIQLFMIKSLVAFLVLITIATSLPYSDQMILANSLIVGKQEQSDLQNWVCKVCDASNRPVHAHYIQQKAKDVKCILSVYPQFIVLAFRYTNTALNVWQDILYPLQIKDQHTCSTCKVQKAYNNMWETIKNEVIADLVQIKKQTKLQKLYITGISLGGGLACISYIDIGVAQIFKDIKVQTFGAPRVGNRNWADHFQLLTNGLSRRFIVSGDPIVVLPHCLTLLCNYKHAGIKIVCYEDLLLCKSQPYNSDDEDPITKIKRIKNTPIDSDIKNMKSIVDHIDGYPKIYNFTLELTQTVSHSDIIE